MKSITDTFILNNKVEIPCVGFGTWQTPDDEIGYKAVKTALEAGYRHIDTAAGYNNEETVGRAIKDSGVLRDQIFITTKLNNPRHGYQETKLAFQESLDRLGVDYIDLFLIHWPNPVFYRDHWQETLQETWKAMEDLYREGHIKAIGVSNFKLHHFKALFETAKIVPAVNQIKLCPGVVPHDVVAYCQDKGILLQAYSPLANGRVFKMDILKDIAAKHHTSIAHVALKWNLQRGFNPLTKSVTPERIYDNAKFININLDDKDMAAINAIDTPDNLPSDPDTVEW